MYSFTCRGRTVIVSRPCPWDTAGRVNLFPLLSPIQHFKSLARHCLCACRTFLPKYFLQWWHSHPAACVMQPHFTAHQPDCHRRLQTLLWLFSSSLLSLSQPHSSEWHSASTSTSSPANRFSPSSPSPPDALGSLGKGSNFLTRGLDVC